MSVHIETNLSPLAQAAIASVPKAAYLHIPFCRRRCYYCDFPVAVLGDELQGEQSQTVEHYVEVLCREIQQVEHPAQSPVETVFFGGGTPSLLSPKQLDRILQVIDRQLGIAPGAEISMEMDPGTFDLAQLQGYLTAGVNRVSLGVQAFQPELLQSCGRTHSVADIYAAVDLIQQAQVQNFSLDLISGLPHQTLEHWQASLAAAIALEPHHLSSYDLIVEPVTAFGRQYQPGDQPLPSDTSAAEMYRLAQQMLTSVGYAHYEVSNYAKPGYQCRHNRVYWENQPFYGFGMGAASYLQGQRFTRPRKTREYYQWVSEQSGVASSSVTSDLCTADDLLLDTLMLGLRLAEGVNLQKLVTQFGWQILPKIAKGLHAHQQRGWIETVGIAWTAIASDVPHSLPSEARLRLTDPEGFLFSNQVLADLFAELD